VRPQINIPRITKATCTCEVWHWRHPRKDFKCWNIKICSGILKKKWIAALNFIKILITAFTWTDPRSVKKTVKLSIFFTLSGSSRVKPACRTLMKWIAGAHSNVFFSGSSHFWPKGFLLNIPTFFTVLPFRRCHRWNSQKIVN